MAESGEEKMDAARRSVANYVEGPRKNPYLVKWSRFYSTKIPMGVREFVFTGPLLIIVLAVAYFIPNLVDVEKFTQGLTPHAQDMREYTLEPLYDEKGQLKGYRHINRRDSPDVVGEEGQQRPVTARIGEGLRTLDDELTWDPNPSLPPTSFTNVMLQREVDLRGLGLSSLDENALILLNNDFDVVNLTANALTSLEYFPVADATAKRACMDRVTTLIAHRNQLQKVSVVSCVLALPNIAHFLADRNNFKAVRDLLFLRHWKKLEILSLEGSPVWEGNGEDFDPPKLRAFLVYLCPTLKLINYGRVRQEDRDRAETLKKEFKALVAQWDGTTGTGVGAAEGKKLRKRGRENRAKAEDGGAIQQAQRTTPPKGSDGAGTETIAAATTNTQSEASAVTAGAAAPLGDGEEDTVQARLNELENRIMSDDITPEEIVALEQEMNELMAEQERRKKRRK